MTERCLRWNITCEFSSKLNYGMDCPFDNTVSCNEQQLKARHRVTRYRVDKFKKGGITGGKIGK